MKDSGRGPTVERLQRDIDINRPFTRADAVAAGISRRTIAGSRFRRIFRDVYISARVKDSPEHRMLAALLLHPADAFASHSTAARHYGVVVPPTAFTHVSAFRDKDRRWAAGLKPHVAPEHTEVVVVRGVRVSHWRRLFIELAAILELVDLVVAGDNMLRVFGIEARTLRAALARSRDYWSAAARHGAEFVRDEVDSPMETRLRMLIVLAGLPTPEVNVKIRDDRGNVVLRFDLAYRDRRLAIEYDGRQHVEDASTWERDIHRDDEVEARAWKKLRVTARGIYVDPADTVHRVWRQLNLRGPRVSEPGDAWRVHFPGHRAAG